MASPTLILVTQSPREHQAAQPEKPAPSLLEFLGKVLDQLSLSAWLPAIMFIGILSLLAQLHGGASFDIGRAVSNLARQPLGILLVIAFGLILTTIITQAFAYESIRLFEGYWGRGRLLEPFAAARIRRHVRRKARLAEQVDQLEKRAFARAREQMLQNHVERVLIDILELQVYGAPARDLDPYPLAKRQEATSMGWIASAPPEVLRQRSAALQRLLAYPADHRLLPTTLGNTLRSHEDRMRRADGGDLEGFVMRNYDRIPSMLMSRHQQSRTRLDMYSTLALVFGVLATAALALLWNFQPWHISALLGAGLFSGLSVLSYAAAVSSARAYGSVLLAIDSYVTATLTKDSTRPLES